MSRLTEFRKDLNRYEYKQDEKGYCYITEGQIVNKLGGLEDLEEDLGFDLKKLQEIEHIYANDFENVYEKVLKKYKIIGVNFKEKKIWFWVSSCPMYLSFEDYKKYFWLKEDKSE